MLSLQSRSPVHTFPKQIFASLRIPWMTSLPFPLWLSSCLFITTHQPDVTHQVPCTLWTVFFSNWKEEYDLDFFCLEGWSTCNCPTVIKSTKSYVRTLGKKNLKAVNNNPQSPVSLKDTHTCLQLLKNYTKNYITNYEVTYTDAYPQCFSLARVAQCSQYACTWRPVCCVSQGSRWSASSRRSRFCWKPSGTSVFKTTPDACHLKHYKPRRGQKRPREMWQESQA